MPTFHAGIAPRFEDLREEFDRLWTGLAAPRLRDWVDAAGDGRSFPPVNVSESDDAVTVEAELPGIDASDVDISVAGDELVLKGERPACTGKPAGGTGDGDTAKGVTWHRRERGSGPFERRISLPVAVDAARVEARLTDGVLIVTCPKAAEAQPHKVAVRPG